MGFMGFIGDGAAYRPNVLKLFWELLLRLLRRSRAKVSFEAGAGKVRKPMLKSNPSTSLALERLYQHS